MLKAPLTLQVRLAAIVPLAFLVGCSGSGSIQAGAPSQGNPPSQGNAAQPLTLSAAPADSCEQGRSAISLGSALAPFAVLAGSTITNVSNTLVTYGPSAIYPASFGGATPLNGDFMGVWPGSAVTGFYPPGKDADNTNAIYAANFNTNRGVPMAAQGALTTAYNTAAGLPATHVVSGDLSQAMVPGYPSGTLPPGVYKSNSTLGIMAGNLTLDGRRNTQSVFVFEVASAFTTTSNGLASGNVILTHGANACNITWQVGSSATLGGATFYGNMLAHSSITLNAKTFTGRALASAGGISIPVAGGALITNPGGK